MDCNHVNSRARSEGHYHELQSFLRGLRDTTEILRVDLHAGPFGAHTTANTLSLIGHVQRYRRAPDHHRIWMPLAMR